MNSGTGAKQMARCCLPRIGQITDYLKPVQCEIIHLNACTKSPIPLYVWRQSVSLGKITEANSCDVSLGSKRVACLTNRGM